MVRSGWLAVTALIFAAAAGCDADGPQASPPASGAPAAPAAVGTADRDDHDDELFEHLLAFARSPTPEGLAPVPLATDGIRLGLGADLLVERSANELVDPANWVLELGHFRGHEGPFSALDLLARVDGYETSVGPHPHCASPPAATHADVADLQRLSVQPVGNDSCIGWFTVDVFVDDRGAIHAITLDLWEP